jgi:diguanylate cyclase (GGDEF)-like protein
MTLEKAIERLSVSVTGVQKAVEEIQKAALRDDKTPLLNGAAFRKLLSGVGSVNQPMALFFGDLNGFKDINLKHSHEGGDAAITAAGIALNEIRLPDEVFLAFRQSGDEFAIICFLKSVPSVTLLLEKRFKDLPVTFESKTFSIQMSFGWTKIEQVDGTHIWTERAEQACNLAKQKGAGVCVEWTPEIGAAVEIKIRKRCNKCGCAYTASHNDLTKNQMLFCPKCGQQEV